MPLFSCFRKSSKPKDKTGKSGSSSHAIPNVATLPQNPTTHIDSITPPDAPPAYNLTDTGLKTPDTSAIPTVEFPPGAIPRSFSNDFGSATQSNNRPPSIASFTSTIPRHDASIDDEFGSLREIDTVILIDDSGSMRDDDCRSATGARITRWEETRTALESMLPIVTKRDPDGIDLYFLNHKSDDLGDARKGKAGTGYRNITSVTKVKSLFGAVKPRGVTPTGQRTRDILTPYVKHLEEMQRRNETVKKLNILCITDGVATDNLEEDIVEFAKKLDQIGAIARQVGIQFFQVGHDVKATEALKELDDELVEQGVRDMVDTTTFGTDAKGRKTLDGEAMIKFVLGGINGRHDKKKLPGRA